MDMFDSPVNQSFKFRNGQYIIERRNALGISQRELAAVCNMPQSSVARIESYKTVPKLDTLIKITKSLGLNLIISSAN